jgi:polyphenol oxidase
VTSGAIRATAEERIRAQPPIWSNPDWAHRFPWLVQGITSSGEGEDPFDLGLFGEGPAGAVLERWRRLREALEVSAAVHARQVHGTRVLSHTGQAFRGLLVLEAADGHMTNVPGLLLTASVADCVPVLMVDERTQVVAAVHAGWRGAAGGIVETTISGLRRRYGCRPGDLWVHLGPCICGRCYEVGPEVHAGVRPGNPAPDEACPIDLREALASRAVGAGVTAEHVSLSTHCTLCGSGGFFSHRGGASGRQMAFIALRDRAPAARLPRGPRVA